ncbi:MAG TPA: thioredoxin fold domain-containing protein [Chthoniobacterales bacterium]|nr:thioredoxin fold domain-containing protein [Chthoniobacterales bacterium]
MKTFRVAALTLLLGLLGLGSTRAEATWLTDFQKAQAEAKAGHKLILLEFTGSDWCIWCMRLEAEVFSRPEFADFAKKNLVLVRADFPRAKPLSAEVRKQNQELAQRYDVDGFPTIVVLSGEGKQVGLLGYMPGGPGPFLDELKKLPKS